MDQKASYWTKPFTAKDLRQWARLSYRQLNVWETKGIIPPSRDEKGGWRRFAPEDVFALIVCASLREKYGIPLDSLLKLRKEASRGFAAWTALSRQEAMVNVLLTDLTSLFWYGPLDSVPSRLGELWSTQEGKEELLILRIDAQLRQLLSDWGAGDCPEDNHGC